jgi:hypothetical protein
MAQPQFQSIVATAAQESIVYQNLNKSGTVTASSSDLIDLYAPPNTICEVKMLSLSMIYVIGATTGSHMYQVSNTLGFLPVLMGRSNFGSGINFDYGEWSLADFEKYPLTNQPYTMLASINFDSVLGIRIKYTNLTNASNTATRVVAIQYKKRTVG